MNRGSNQSVNGSPWAVRSDSPRKWHAATPCSVAALPPPRLSGTPLALGCLSNCPPRAFCMLRLIGHGPRYLYVRPSKMTSIMPRLNADFNGLFGDILCLSHNDYCLDENGEQVPLKSGMKVTVFQDPLPDQIIASGVVEASPEWLQCSGSKWALKIDENGVRVAATGEKA